MYFTGGPGLRPGEASLAHNGVLFLDELPEFRRSVLEALREPLEEGSLTVCRARGNWRFPARFQLMAAMNPCPCGSYGSRIQSCGCTPKQVRAYRGRVSGPLLDRIDLHAEVAAIPYAEMAGAAGESSTVVAARVQAARERQLYRSGQTGALTNSVLSPAQVERVGRPDENGRRLLAAAVDRFGLSGRGHDRILRVARTIADLEGIDRVTERHVAEALQYRRCGSDTGSSTDY